MSVGAGIKVTLVGLGTFLVYKMFVPSSEQIQAKIYEDHGEPGAPMRTKQDAFSRVVKLSSDGYSFEAITKILAKEEKDRYNALYAKEKAERLAAYEAQKKASRESQILSAGIKDAVSFLSGE